MFTTVYISSTDVRKEFSSTIDKVIHCKPQFVQRTHNKMVMIEEGELNSLLSVFNIPVKFIKENDGSFLATNSVIEDVFSTGATKEEAMSELCKDLIEYAQEYYDNYDLYSKTPNRKKHAPYVMRILSSPSVESVRGMLHA